MTKMSYEKIGMIGVNKMNESIIKKKIIRRLKQEGIKAYKIHGSSYQASGIPDIIAAPYGLFWGIEIKTAIGQASKKQLHEKEMLEKSNAAVDIIHSLEDFESALIKIKRKVKLWQQLENLGQQ